MKNKKTLKPVFAISQHDLGRDSTFIFPIGSEEKANWMWADNGIGYFLKSVSGEG